MYDQKTIKKYEKVYLKKYMNRLFKSGYFSSIQKAEKINLFLLGKKSYLFYI